MSISRAIAPAGPPIWVLVLAVSSSNIGVSLLSPAVPLIRQSFLATADQVQLVLTGFMMALGIGQLIAGTLSDRFGRRPVMLVGSALFLLGGVGAFIATSIDMLVLMRVLQGAGAA
ncbi:MAG: MFS transporter, partial [Candidatus Puniceispirillaceae bacterium]